jgi:hypothetical protein
MHYDILFCTEEFVVEAIFVSFYYGSTPRTTGNPDTVVILFFRLSTQMPGYIDLIGHITSKFVHNFREYLVI